MIKDTPARVSISKLKWFIKKKNGYGIRLRIVGFSGAAIGPLMAGPLSRYGWHYVFYTLMVASAMAALVSHSQQLLKNKTCILRICEKKEIMR